MFRRARFLLMGAGCAFVGATAAAQTAGDAVGAIDGTIRDGSGGVLPQVIVRAVGPALMGVREDVSRDDGFYRIAALAPGQYELTFTRAGFEQTIRRDVRVRPGATTSISVTLDLEGFRESVIVGAAAPGVDRRGTSLAAVMDAQQLSDLPGSRSVPAILAAAPAIQLTGFDVGGNTALASRGFSAYGFPGYNRPTLEGIDISQQQRFAFQLDYGSFDQAWVGLGAYGSQLPSPGVHLQVLAKSGGDRYRGSLYAGYQSGAWQARNIDAGQVARGVAGAVGLPARDVNRQDGYQDINADIGGFVVRSRWWWYASIRDQRVAARVVSFTAAPIATSATIGSAKTTIRTGANGTLVLYAHPAVTRQPIHLGAFLRPEALNTSTDSTSSRKTKGTVWKAEWNAPLGANLLASARVGQFVVWRDESPRGVSPRVEDLATPAVEGGNRTWREDLARTQVNGSLGYLREGRGGRHQLTVGGETLRAVAAETWYRGYPGDVLHVLRDRTPAEVYLFQTPSLSRAGQWWYSAFLNDSWYAHDRLTITGGVRYDRFRIFLPEQEHPIGRFNATPQTFPAVNRLAAWNAFAPRIGASVDPIGDGRTFIKSTYGVYRLPPGTDVGFNGNPNAPAWWTNYEWTDGNSDGLWQPGEEAAFLERRGGAAPESLDRELRLAYVREATGHVERDLGPLHLSTGVIWRAQRQQGLRQLSNRSFEMFTVSTILRDPGPGATTLTAGGDGPEIRVFDVPGLSVAPPDAVVRNVPRSNSDYATWEIAAARRLTGRWSLDTSFAHTWNHDHAAGYLGQAVRANQYAVTPNDLINTDEGGRHVFRTWAAKAHGTWLGPWGLRVSPLVRHQSGQPFARIVVARLNVGTIRVLAEPIGARRQDNVTLIDLSARKDFVLLSGRRASVFVEAFNLFNANPEQTLSWVSGPSFLRPLSIVPPRIARVGMRMDW